MMLFAQELSLTGFATILSYGHSVNSLSGLFFLHFYLTNVILRHVKRKK